MSSASICPLLSYLRFGQYLIFKIHVQCSSVHPSMKAARLELGRVLEKTPITRGLGKALSSKENHNQKVLGPKSSKRRKPRRRLTIENVPATNQSSLLWLPREIRDVIWRYACMDMKVHLWMQNGKLQGQLCRSEGEHCQLRCTAWIQKAGNPPFQKMGIMGLLLSCRSM